LELDIPTWMMVLILLIIIIVVINFLNARSDAFSEEIRKSKVIEELPITKKDINKLFKKKKPSNTKRKYGGSFTSRKIDFDNFDEFSPLKILGYAVGVSGLKDSDRLEVLNFAIFGDFQRYMPEQIDYDARWGSPGSRNRFSEIYNHIRRVKNLRNNRKNMSHARRDWEADMSYIQQQQRFIYKFKLKKPADSFY